MWHIYLCNAIPPPCSLRISLILDSGPCYHTPLLCNVLAGPAEYDLEGVTYLAPEDQEQLPYRIVSLLPWNHFGRKNVGYLYAVHHGAKV
ncbi:unnamed protein product, partial [Laminaria digitata]